MVAIRFFIGFVEAAFRPGALLILSKWYTRRELTLRNALLFCGNLISNAFSSLVGAAVLGNLDGALGHEGWRWLYWIEGAATMAIAISAAFILVSNLALVLFRWLTVPSPIFRTTPAALPKKNAP
jgi:MFS family permease